MQMSQKKDIIKDASVLGVPKMLLLGLQHMFAMFGATILVPMLVNSYFKSENQVLSIQVTLFCAGFGTLFFHLCSKLKVPAFLGSSFAFLGGFLSIANLKSGIFANMPDSEKLQYACGGIFVAGLLYLFLALIIKLIGGKARDAFSSSSCDRTNHYLYRIKPCAICCKKCFYQLADCNCRISYHYYL